MDGLGIVGGLEKESLPVISALSCLLPLAHARGRVSVGGRLGAFDVTSRSWRCEIGKPTFGKATSGTPYSPSSSGWFGFTARKHLCPEEVPEVRGVLPR